MTFAPRRLRMSFDQFALRMPPEVWIPSGLILEVKFEFSVLVQNLKFWRISEEFVITKSPGSNYEIHRTHNTKDIFLPPTKEHLPISPKTAEIWVPPILFIQ